jgi:hypothetical protein
MYREASYPGIPSEWRHESTGQPLSWSPMKHLASRTHVVPHGHHFELTKTALVRCAVSGCEAEMLPRTNRVRVEPENLSEKQTALRASRRRGAVRGSAAKRAQATPPEGNPDYGNPE